MQLTRGFGHKLRDLRIEAGLTPAELASRCRLSTSAITSIELARSEPRLSIILILCDGLGITPDRLIGDLPTPQLRRGAPPPELQS
jgi:transcriptional regulator with XRE-family HTH domain